MLLNDVIVCQLVFLICLSVGSDSSHCQYCCHHVLYKDPVKFNDVGRHEGLCQLIISYQRNLHPLELLELCGYHAEKRADNTDLDIGVRACKLEQWRDAFYRGCNSDTMFAALFKC
jgi:hypothetical protein